MYIPIIGHSVVARRKEHSKIYHNTIIGSVIDTWSNACRIITNKDTEIEGDFKLYYNDWNIEFLFE